MNKFLENNCGRCKHYIENFEFNNLPGRCGIYDIFVGKSETKPCFIEKKLDIKVSDKTDKLVPINSNPIKEYMIIMENPDDNVKVSIEQKNATQDNYKIIYEYIKRQLKDVIQIIDLSEINEVKL